MKAKSIQTGNTYHITFGRNDVLGEVIAATETGWQVRLAASDKVVKVNNSDRFLRKARTIRTTQEEQPEPQVEPAPEMPTEPQKKRGSIKGLMSGLDAAAKILTEDNTKMNVRQITEAAIERGYWSPEGKSPAATISSGIQREIRDKGQNSRFMRVGKGLFATYAPKDEQNY